MECLALFHPASCYSLLCLHPGARSRRTFRTVCVPPSPLWVAGGDAPGTPAFNLTAAVLGAEADLSREREAGTGLVGAPPRRHMEKGKERT